MARYSLTRDSEPSREMPFPRAALAEAVAVPVRALWLWRTALECLGQSYFDRLREGLSLPEFEVTNGSVARTVNGERELVHMRRAFSPPINVSVQAFACAMPD